MKVIRNTLNPAVTALVTNGIGAGKAFWYVADCNIRRRIVADKTVAKLHHEIAQWFMGGGKSCNARLKG